ncbi:MAG: chromosome partitioning protein ParA [Alphaproteobacteria bacterium PA2]|nr:MAG: chromosome partitioning protein ParA [Alphaproteobacteria bacterium PA2]
MKTLAVIAQKGGAGKTTVALNLAVEASRRGASVIVLDLDPQASAAAWSDWRGKDDVPVVAVPSTRLSHVLKEAEEADVGLVVIDTPPAADGAAVAAARAADLILIPARASAFDLDAIRTTIELMRVAQKPAFALLNALPPRASKLKQEAAALIEEAGLPLVSVEVTERSAFRHAALLGLGAMEFEPEGKAAAEIERLYDWLADRLGNGSKPNLTLSGDCGGAAAKRVKGLCDHSLDVQAELPL